MTIIHKYLNIFMILLVSASLFLTSCDSDDSTEPTVLKTLEASTQQELRNMMDTMITNRGIPGAIVMVEKPGYEPFFISVGVRDIESKEALKTDHKFLVGSISKTFVAEVILQFIKEGKLSLDDKLVQHYNEITIPGIENVTIRQLLGHTSGMGNYLNQWFVPWAFANRSQPISREALIDSLNTDELYFAPGDTVEYSNSAYIVLGLLAEKIGKEPIEDLVRKYYTEPMGLTNSHFPKNISETSQYLSNETHGYATYIDGQTYDVTLFEPSYTWAAGAVVSNAYDLRLHLKELLSGKKMLTPALQTERMKMNETTLHGYGTVKFGLAVAQIGTKYQGHSGGWLGYNTNAYYRTDKSTFIITHVNKYSGGENPAWDLFIYVNQILFPNDPPMMFPYNESQIYGNNYKLNSQIEIK
jgi:D-alanyl-D-alanine carboxypeptidase